MQPHQTRQQLQQLLDGRRASARHLGALLHDLVIRQCLATLLEWLENSWENMGKTMGKTMELVRDSEFIENDGKAMEKSHGKIPWKTPGVISTLDPNINHIIHLIPPFMFLRMAFGEVEPPFNRSNLRPRSFMSSTSCRLSCCSKVSPAWAL